MTENETLSKDIDDEVKPEVPNQRLSFLRRNLKLRHLCNPTCCLAIVVVILFIQMQLLTWKVHVEEHRVESFLEQIQEAEEAVENLDTKVEEEHDLTIQHMAGTLTLLTFLLAALHSSAHIRNYHEPVVQRKILAIILCAPVYGLTAFLTLLLPASVEGYLAVIKDFYEAFLIYTFLSFLIAVLGRGDRSAVVQKLAQHADHLKDPYKCLGCFFYPHPSDSSGAKANAVLLECQILAMQFVFVRPITSILNFVIVSLRDHSSNASAATEDETTAEETLNYFTSPSFMLAMITNISIVFAFAGLLKFYHAVQHELDWCKPLYKFLCIKGIVFLTFWQGLLIHIVVGFQKGDLRKASQTQHVLICLEMLLFAIAHWCTFPPEEWAPNFKPASSLSADGGGDDDLEGGGGKKKQSTPGIGLKDFAKDVKTILNSRRKRRKAKRVQKGNPEALVYDPEEEVPNAMDDSLGDGDSLESDSKEFV